MFNHDITYCAASDCSNKECERHLERLEGYGKNYVSIANFSGICRYYISEVLHENDAVRGEKNEAATEEGG